METHKANGWAEISHSRSKKKPFKVIIYGRNGEPLQAAQLFTTTSNAYKNIHAVLRAFNGSSVVINNKISGTWQRRFADGHSEKVK